MNSLTAYALALELNEALPGTTIKNITRYTGGYTLSLDHPTIRYLHVLHFGREPEFVPSESPLVSAANTTAVRSTVERSTIRKVAPLGVDRIVLFTVTTGGSWGEEERSILRFDMTPAGAPISVFRSGGAPAEWHGPLRGIRPAAPDDVPAQKPFSILTLPTNPPDELATSALRRWPENTPEHTRRWGDVKRTARALIESVGGLDPVLAAALSRTFSGNLAALWPSLAEIGDGLSEGRFSWRRYEFPEEGPAGRCAIYPVALPVMERAVVMGSAFEAIGERAREIVRPAFVHYLRSAALTAARRSLAKSERLAARLAGDLEEARRARELRRFGNLLVTNRHLIKRGMSEIEVRDFSQERTVSIPLSPKATPDDNIRRYFIRAKKGEKGILIITARKREIERAIDEKRSLIDRISNLDKPDDLAPFMPRRAGKPKREEKVTPTFKRFTIDARHTVFVGRKDRENDALTHRFAAPRDLWFHAQGVPGSHVILKGANRSTPKSVLERAASIAAYFSKARHSSTVPVIYTEKRYVRKPRGSPPGTAVCLRGKTLYVKPAPPEERDQKRGTNSAQ